MRRLGRFVRIAAAAVWLSTLPAAVAGCAGGDGESDDWYARADTPRWLQAEVGDTDLLVGYTTVCATPHDVGGGAGTTCRTVPGWSLARIASIAPTPGQAFNAAVVGIVMPGAAARGYVYGENVRAIVPAGVALLCDGDINQMPPKASIAFVRAGTHLELATPVEVHITDHEVRDGKLSYGVTVDDGPFAGSKGTIDDPTGVCLTLGPPRLRIRLRTPAP